MSFLPATIFSGNQLLTSNVKVANIEKIRSGPIIIENGYIRGVNAPVLDSDVATKSYVLSSIPIDASFNTLTVIDNITTPLLTGLSTPTNDTDATNKLYVDSQAGGGAVAFLIQVQKNPIAGQFSSIYDALASITDSSDTKPYCVQVGPGIYEELELVIPEYVSVKGSSISPTVVKPASPNQHLFVMSTATELSFMTLQGIEGSLSPGAGTGFAAVYCANVGDFAQMHKISIYDFDIGIYNFSSTASSILYVEYTDVNGNYSYSVKNKSTNGFQAFTVLEDFFSYPSESSTKTAIINDGSLAKIQITGSSLYGSTGMIGLVLQNGGEALVGSVLFQDFRSGGIVSLNTGSGAILKIDGTTFNNCTPDFNILNAGTTGYFFGNSPRNNHFIAIGSDFFIAGQDNNLINVAKKGGDYTSIKTAVDSITDASPTNVYLIKIGPGIFFENTITLSPGIFLIGYFLNATTIVPIVSNSTVIVLSDVSYIKDIYITGATGINGTAVSFSGSNGLGTLVRDCAFGSNTTNIRVFGNTAPTLIVIDRCSILGNCTECLIVTNNPGIQTRITVDNTFYRDLVAPVATNFMRASGVGVTVNVVSTLLLVIPITGNKGFLLSDGVDFKITGSSITGFDNAIYVPTGVTSPVTINGSGVLINGSGSYDIYIGSNNTLGSWLGDTIYTKTSIPTGSPFFLAGSDSTIVTVQKSGGDFTSVVSALAAITDAVSAKRYVINVGAGTFVESEIVLKQYVSIHGQGRSTIIEADASNHHVIRGCDFVELSSMIITGAGAGYAAIYLETPAGTANTAMICRQILFGTNDTHVWTYGNVGQAHIILFNCRYGGNATFNYGFRATNNNSVASKITIIGTTSQDFTSPMPIYVCYASGPGSTVSVNSFNAIHNSSAESGTVGFKVDNGALIRMLATTVRGFATAVLSSNSGSAPTIIASGCTITDCTTDINIAHPDTLGSINVSASRIKTVVNGMPPVSVFLVDAVDSGIAFSGPFYYSKNNFNELTNISNLVSNTPTMGLISGGSISTNSTSASLNITVAAGFGYQTVGTNPATNVLTYRSWLSTSLAIPANSNNYVYMNTSGAIVSGASYPDTTQNILIGKVSTNSNDIIYMQQAPLNANHYTNQLSLMLKNGIGPIYSSGSAVSELGTRTLTVSAGLYYFTNIQFIPAGGSPVTFDIYYRSAVAGIYTPILTQTTVPNTSYDNGSGTLIPLTASYYTKHLLLLLGGPGEQYALVYGQDQYSSEGLAEAAGVPLTPSFVSDAFVRVASIIVQQGTSNIVSIIDERPRIGFASSSATGVVTVHGDLQGLEANDHPQYLLVDGSAPGMQGSLDMNGNDILDVGLFNGFNVSAHASRHQFNGADPLTAAVANEIAEISDTVAFAGTNNASVPRADHQHPHGQRGGGLLHSLVIASTATTSSGFMSGADKIKLNGIATGATNTTASTAAPVNVTKSTADAGVSSEVSRQDHKHDISTAAAIGLTTSSLNLEGTSTFLARADHSHNILSTSPVQILPDQSNAIGNSTAFARADHIHNVPSGVPVALNANSAVAQGAASSFAISNHSHSIASAAPTALQIFGSSAVIGTSASFARADHIHIYSTDMPLSISSVNFEGTSTSFARADHVHNHGQQSDPSFHSLVIAGSNAGFMSGSDKQILNTLATLPSGSILVGSTSNTTSAVAMSGDATIAAGGTITLANSGVSSGSYIPTTLVVNSKGLITSASRSLASGSIIVGNTSSIATVSVMSGDATLAAGAVLTLSTTGVTAANYTFPTSVSIDAKGRVESANSFLGSGQFILGSVSNIGTAVTMSGDVTLVAGGSATVVRINGAPLGTTTATTGNLLIGDGTNWNTKNVSGDATLSSTGVITLSNTSVTANTYTAPTSISVNGKGQLTNVSTNLASGSIIIGNTGGVSSIVAVSGDISLLATGATTVSRINGVPLGVTTATAGNLLVANGTNWTTKQIIGDSIIDSSGSVTVTRINGVGLGATTATAGNLLVASGTQWVSQPLSGDATIGTGGTLLLSTSGVIAGSYVPTSITVSNKGIVTSASSSLAAGSIILGNTANIAAVSSISGDVSLAATGVATVSRINGSLLGVTTPSAGSLLIGSSVQWTSQTISGDATLSSSGALTLSTTGVTPGTYNVVSATVDAKGRLSSVSQTLPSGNIIIGSLTNLATSVPVTGDLSITAAGITSVNRISGNLLGTTSVTTGNLLIANGTSWNSQSISGDTTLTAAGVSSVTKINGSSLGVTTATAGNLLIGNGTSWNSQQLSGDATLGTSGILILATSGITAGSFVSPTTLVISNKGLVTSASTSLTAGSFVCGSNTNIATISPMSGDVSLAAGGVTTVSRINGSLLGVTTPSAGSLLIGSSVQWTSQTVSGDATLSTGGVLVLSTTGVASGVYAPTSITVDTKGRVSAVSQALPSGNIIIGSLTNVATSTAISGDVSLSAGGVATVSRINGSNLGVTTATSGNLLVGSGTSWISQPVSGDVTMSSSGALTLVNSSTAAGTYVIPTSITTTNKGQITSISSNLASGSIIIGNTAGVSSTAVVSGDISLAGTGIATVSRINGTALGTTTATSGNLLIGNGTSWNTQPISGDASISAGGILVLATSGVTAGTYAFPTSITTNNKGQISSASTALANGSIIIGNAGVSSAVAVSGDVSLTASGVTTVSRINGSQLGTTTATAGNFLIGNGTSWNTQPISGDATIGTGGVLVLATSGVTAGTYAFPTSITTTNKGQISSASTALANGSIIIGNTAGVSSSVPITGDVSLNADGVTVVARINGATLGVTNAVAGNLLVGSGINWTSQIITGDATMSAGGVLTLANSGVAAATYALPINVAVNAKGQITSATNVPSVNNASLLTNGSGVPSWTAYTGTLGNPVMSQAPTINNPTLTNLVLSTPNIGTASGASLITTGAIGSSAFPAFSTVIYSTIANTVVITAAQILSGYIDNTIAANNTSTLPTASAIVNAIGRAYVGMSFHVYFRKSGANTLTIALGTGITAVAGTTLTVVALSVRGYIFNITNVITPAILLLPLGTATY